MKDINLQIQRRIAGSATILAPVFLGMAYLLQNHTSMVMLIFFILFLAALVTAACMWGVIIINAHYRRKNRKVPSPFAVFAVIDAVLLLLTTAYAVYDLITSTGYFAGLLGIIILLYGSTVMFGLLCLDIIIWCIYNRKKRLKNKNKI